MTNEDDVSDSKELLTTSNKKADDPKPSKRGLSVAITWFNLILDNK